MTRKYSPCWIKSNSDKRLLFAVEKNKKHHDDAKNLGLDKSHLCCALININSILHVDILSQIESILKCNNLGVLAVSESKLKNGLILPTGQWYAPSAIINDVWYCMVLLAMAWYCMVLHGIKWYCMHTLYLSFFLHSQNFWRIKFTPKNANFLS